MFFWVKKMNKIKVIEVQNLTKYYPEVLAVNRVGFTVNKGDVVGFLGPNGAGKTTTLKMLTCFLPPTSGEAKVCGFDISQDPTSVRQNIGYLPEHNALYEEMRVKEYLTFRATLKGVKWRLRKPWVEEAIETCRLEDVANRVIAHLSKGYRQRVGLADTLVHKPPVLIFDEPTVGLDPAQIIEVRALIKKLSQENTVLLSTHYLTEVEQICDHAVIITGGRVVAADSIANLTTGQDGEKVPLEEVFLKLTRNNREDEVELKGEGDNKRRDGKEKKGAEEGEEEGNGKEKNGKGDKTDEGDEESTDETDGSHGLKEKEEKP